MNSNFDVNGKLPINDDVILLDSYHCQVDLHDKCWNRCPSIVQRQKVT